jgi:glycosyltransferase involved in cell wall biosynthesis
LKVLHIIKTLGLGGAETNLLNLTAAFDSKDIESHIAYSHGGENEGRFKNAGARLFKYAEGQHKIKSLQTFGIVACLVRYIRANRIDIVHTHNSNAQVWGCLAAKLTGVKLVEHVHDSRYMEEEEYRARRGTTAQYKYIRFFTRWSDRVVVLTKGNREYLLKHCLCREERIREIQNGIPLGVFTPPPADRFGIAKEDPVILLSVRMAPEKNVDLVLRVAPAVLREVPNAVFLMAGDGPLLDELKKSVENTPIGARVRFIGFQPDVPALLGMTQVFLLPSFLELHSISILEALSQGVPAVVSSGVGCNSETLKDGVDAFLLDPFSDEGWAAAVVRLLKDRELGRKMGESGRKLCRERFDIQKTARRFEELYKELFRHGA